MDLTYVHQSAIAFFSESNTCSTTHFDTTHELIYKIPFQYRLNFGRTSISMAIVEGEGKKNQEQDMPHVGILSGFESRILTSILEISCD